MRYGRCLITAAVTYSSALSKNARIGYSHRGKIYIRKEAKAAEAILFKELTSAIKSAKIKWYQNRIYLDIHVHKPRTNIDCINFLDAIADVLKNVLGVDDRYYGVKSIDWTLARKDPKIVIKLYQPVRRDADGDKSKS